jgi:hypothetical protein
MNSKEMLHTNLDIIKDSYYIKLSLSKMIPKEMLHTNLKNNEGFILYTTPSF